LLVSSIISVITFATGTVFLRASTVQSHSLHSSSRARSLPQPSLPQGQECVVQSTPCVTFTMQHTPLTPPYSTGQRRGSKSSHLSSGRLSIVVTTTVLAHHVVVMKSAVSKQQFSLQWHLQYLVSIDTHKSPVSPSSHTSVTIIKPASCSNGKARFSLLTVP